MAGLFDALGRLAEKPPPAPGRTRFPRQLRGLFPPEAHPVKPKLPGSRDRNRIDPRRPFRAPTLLKV